MFKKDEPLVTPHGFEDHLGNMWRLELLVGLPEPLILDEEDVIHVSRTFHAILQRLDERGEDSGAPYVLIYKFPTSYLRSNFLSKTTSSTRCVEYSMFRSRP